MTWDPSVSQKQQWSFKQTFGKKKKTTTSLNASLTMKTLRQI